MLPIKRRHKRFANVKTAQGCVIEFQYSHLNPEECRARENFYGEMAWVVNGCMRKKDRLQFQKALTCGSLICREPMVLEVSTDDSALIREWGDSHVLVFFDFSHISENDRVSTSGKLNLWCLLPTKAASGAYLTLVSRAHFIKVHREGKYNGLKHLVNDIEKATLARRQTVLSSQHSWAGRPKGFQHYWARKQRARSRRRM